MSNHEEFIQEIECKNKLISIFPRGLVFENKYPYRFLLEPDISNWDSKGSLAFGQVSHSTRLSRHSNDSWVIFQTGMVITLAPKSNCNTEHFE